MIKKELAERLGDAKDVAQYALQAKLFIAKRVSASLGDMIDAQIEKAIQGDTNAFIALMDRAHGKPAQSIEHTGDGGQPIVFMPMELIQKHALQVATSMVNNSKEKQ